MFYFAVDKNQRLSWYNYGHWGHLIVTAYIVVHNILCGVNMYKQRSYCENSQLDIRAVLRAFN